MTLSFSDHQQLTEAERFQLFVEGVRDYAIYMLSPEGIINSWNAGAERFKGYKAEEIVGQHFSRFYTEKDLATNLPARALNTALKEGKFEDEGWRLRKNGSRFWAHVVIDPIRNAEGELVGFAKITRDITDQKKAAEALHASEERFRLLIQSVTDYAIYMLSPTGEVSNWNAGATRIKGYTEAEAVNTHFSRFYTEEDQLLGLPMRALQMASEKGTFESEGWRVRKDGSRFWAHVVIEPIKNQFGELVGFAKVTRDITERRDANIALEKAREALVQAQKLESIGKLTGGVAHDFNNLLSVIVNGLAILRMEICSENSLKILDSMERAATRGAALTNQLLMFARRQPLKQESHNLNRVINSFEAVLRRANKGSATFELNLASHLPNVMIDATQFEAALLNLVVNARDAISANGTVELHTETLELQDQQINHLPAGTYVKVSVIDDGDGMPQDVVERAFEPFFTTKPVGQGTGLGLSQVYGLVQQSGGDMTIQSTVGTGTAISLYLPALPDDMNESSAAQKRQTALVVDDQPDVLDMASALFKTLGYDVLTANSAEDALNIVKRVPELDVLFSDVVMPGMSGVELGEAASAILPDLTVILASGYTELSLKIANDKFEKFHFIRKPYRISEITEKLRQ